LCKRNWWDHLTVTERL